MFGYIKPLEGELLVKELELYKAVYCGLCRAMKTHVSCFTPMTLSYDCTLLALFRMALERTPPKVCKKRCIAHPFRKKRCVISQESDALCYSARAGTLLLYYKLCDDIRDGDKGFFRRILCRIAKAFMTPSVKKMCKKDAVISALSADLEDAISELGKMEKENSRDLDRLCEASGRLLALCASAGLTGENHEIAYSYGMSVGKWLYIVDAFDDIESDKKKNCFNPLTARFGDTAKDNAEAVEVVLSHYIFDAAEQLKRLAPTCYNNILNNITCPGLESSGKKVLFQSKGKAK